MSILWVGGEDIDFPNGTAVNVVTTSGEFRTGFARCSISSGGSTNYCKSTLFPGGAITSGWLSCQFYAHSAISGANPIVIGFGSSSGGGSQINGIGFSTGASGSSSTVGSITMTTTSGATITTTYLETGANIFTQNALNRVDLQLINYGPSGTLNLYVNNVLMLSFTGNLSISGITGFDCVNLCGQGQNTFPASEILVSSDDSRAYLGVVTDYPTGNGTTQSWSNPAYTNFNPITINDANSTFSNTNAQDEQATIQDIPAGNFKITTVKVASRAEVTPGSSVSGIALGFNNTNNTTVAVGAKIPVGVAFTTYEQYFATDPTTSSAWGSNLTGYQLDMRSQT